MTRSRLKGVKESLEVSSYQPPLYFAQTAFTNEGHELQRCWHNNHLIQEGMFVAKPVYALHILCRKCH
jgi:hypothetical protein